MISDYPKVRCIQCENDCPWYWIDPQNNLCLPCTVYNSMCKEDPRFKEYYDKHKNEIKND